jgi:hypothetical protein
MTRRLRSVSLILAGLAVAFAITAAATDPPPGWEPEANVLGTITFYDAAGTPLTGGLLNDHPLAAYAAASSAGRTGDSLAQIKVFTPQVGVVPQLWTGDSLTGAVTYPNKAAPAPVAQLTVPVVSSTKSDLSLSDYIGEFPNTLTDPAYANLYEIRLYTSGPGVNQNIAYFRVDVVVDAVSWRVVYPPPGGGGPTTTPPTTTAPTTTSPTTTSPTTTSPTTTPTDGPPSTTPPPTTAPPPTAPPITPQPSATPTPTPTVTATPTSTPTPTPTTAAPTFTLNPPPAAATHTTRPPVARGPVVTPTEPGPTDTVGGPSPTAEAPTNTPVPPPDGTVGGNLTLAAHSSSIVAFAGLSILLALGAIATFVLGLRTRPADTGDLDG